MTIEYNILERRSRKEMLEIVREFIADGWEPLGGLSVIAFQEPAFLHLSDRPGDVIPAGIKTEVRYSQAVIRRAIPEPSGCNTTSSEFRRPK